MRCPIEWYAVGVRQRHDWDGSPVVVGSEAGCTIRLSGPDILPRHVRLAKDGHYLKLDWIEADTSDGIWRVARTEVTTVPHIVFVGRTALRVGRPNRLKRLFPLALALLALPWAGTSASRPAPQSNVHVVPVRIPALVPETMVRWAEAQERAAAFEPGALGRAWQGWCSLRDDPAYGARARQRCAALAEQWALRRRTLLRLIERARDRHDPAAAEVALERYRREAEPFGDGAAGGIARAGAAW